MELVSTASLAALPFGGYKQLGGREMGREALGMYRDVKGVCSAL